ncbi:MAG: lytic transglycosylase domain-containing protein [Candidatus Brocadiia bacterium]
MNHEPTPPRDDLAPGEPPCPARPTADSEPHPSTAYREGFDRWLRGEDRRVLRRRLALIAAATLVALGALAGIYLLIRPPPPPEGLRHMAAREALETDLDPALVWAVIQVESGGRPDAVSRAGAIGLMQLMPRTAEEVAAKHGISLAVPDDLYEPELNVFLGTRYLAYLKRYFDDDPWLYLAAYNGGITRIDRLRLQHPHLPSRELVERYAPTETQAYVPKVLAKWRAARHAEPEG